MRECLTRRASLGSTFPARVAIRLFFLMIEEQDGKSRGQILFAVGNLTKRQALGKYRNMHFLVVLILSGGAPMPKFGCITISYFQYYWLSPRYLVPACIFLGAPSNQLILLHSSTCSIDSGAELIASLSMSPGNIEALIIASPIQGRYGDSTVL